MKTKKLDPPLSIDVPFDEALERFIKTDPKEIEVDEDTQDLPTDGQIELPKATHQGQMPVGGLMLDCYVLADGRRVFHKRGMAKALGMVSTGGNAFMKTMSRKGLGSALPAKLREQIANPINFKPLTQDLAHGYDADVLVDVAKAIVAADKAGLLTKAQHNLAIQAQVLVNAFAKVGVVALIDEATGYQQIRNPDALRLLIQQYVDEEMREWEKEFPDVFYDEINRMYGNKALKQTKTGIVVQNRPQHIAGFTRSYVYEPLENGEVLKELDRVNPVIDKKGTRRVRFHQHLKAGFGIEKLRRQVQEILTLVSVSDNVSQFRKLFSKRFHGQGDLGL
jgi:P63C domain